MKKILIGAVLAGIVIIVMGMIFGAVSSEMYKMSPKVLWKPMGGDWFLKAVIFDFASALILAWAYSLLKNAIPGSGPTKGASFGLIVFIIGPLLGLFMTYLTMAVRTKLIVIWGLNSLVNYVLSGMIFDSIDRKIS